MGVDNEETIEAELQRLNFRVWLNCSRPETV